MLETDEVDDDFFTPVASTSLANIFAKAANPEEVQNESLKYSPPKPQSFTDTGPPPKAIDCLFACALFAYQWMDKGYQSKGKIGFAIMRSKKDNVHSIVLYDSKKQNMSTTKITPELVITVKADSYLSFYDSVKRYWNVYSTTGEISKIVNLLKTMEVNVKNINSSDNVPPDSQADKDQSDNADQADSVEGNEKEKDSDTEDSSINKKTKAAILNRMANMGHSVLPRVNVSPHKKSDSSDTNATDDDNDTSKGHRSSKTNSKKSRHASLTGAVSYSYSEKQLVPQQSKSADHDLATDTDLKLFITEQRINNTEVRMNINRLSDKLDKIIEKSSCTNKSDNETKFHTEIFQKLISEYEAKIKVYEQLAKPKSTKAKILPIDQPKDDERVAIISELTNQITEYSEQVKKKDAENKLLLEEKEILKKQIIEKDSENKLLLEEIETLKNQLTVKDEDIEIEKKKLDIVADVIKTVMNDTFIQIVGKFQSGKTYTSDFIKSTIAEVIKHSTIRHLSEQKH